MLEEHVHELPQHVVQSLDQLLGNLGVLGRGNELPLGSGRGKGDGQAASPAGQRDRRRRLASVPLRAEANRDVLGAGDQLDLVA